MSYQVLARKWRPHTFPQVVGQEHVLRALINALDNNRLHHAYLFTGTRGVGKTTLGRILAKSLNCEQGVSSQPCGQCSACLEIDQGRFVDLLEVDAASRTKVEDTRELLENVQYAPTRGRFKVYLIDEVHMLSNHSFNALLKTLEEPPPHVKFILATTDPQKLPVTILSRCLKFNLKVIPLDQIVEHLNNVLQQENIEFEAPAIRLVARAANGSLRDALSLADQAIAYGAGAVREAEVRAMLGTMNRSDVAGLLSALAEDSGQALLDKVEQLAQMGVDFAAVLEELMSTLHAIALKQVVPEHADDDPQVTKLASQLSPEAVQLYYQIGLTGRRDLPLAPDARTGFEMTMLRMLAFRPEALMTAAAPAATARLQPQQQAAPRGAAQPHPAAAEPQAKAPPAQKAPAQPAGDAPRSPLDSVRARLGKAQSERPAATPKRAAQVDSPVRQATEAPPIPDAPPEYLTEAPSQVEEPRAEEPWQVVVQKLKLAGIVRQIAVNAEFRGRDGDTIHLGVAPAHQQMASQVNVEKLQQALGDYYQAPIRLQMHFEVVQGETPAMVARREHNERMQAAAAALHNDPVVQDMKATFGAEIDPNSIQLPDEQ